MKARIDPPGRAAPVSVAELIADLRSTAKHLFVSFDGTINEDVYDLYQIADQLEAALLGPVPVSEGQEECPTCGGCVTVTYPTIGEPVYKAAIGSRLPGPPSPTCSKCRTSWSADGVYICPECGWSQSYRADVPQAGGPVPGGAPQAEERLKELRAAAVKLPITEHPNYNIDFVDLRDVLKLIDAALVPGA